MSANEDASYRGRIMTRICSAAIGSVLALMLLVAVSEVSGGSTLVSARRIAWRPHLERVEAALRRHDTLGALMAWREAYAAALATRQWEGLVDVAEAYVRIGEADASREAAAPKARKIYSAALFRARHAGSVTGVLRVAEAFSALGDDAVVEACIRIARELAAQARDAVGEERVRSFAARWFARQLEVQRDNTTRTREETPR